MAKWEELVKAKREALANQIPSEWKLQSPPSEDEKRVIDFPEKSGLFTKEELEITGLDAATLVKKLQARELKAYDVAKAFCHRAAVAQQLVNCCAEIFFEKALAQAKELDDYYEKNGKPIGPLHGLPVSLKDQFRVKGEQCAMGYVGWIGKKDEKDSVLTECLRSAGAVFYVKTTVPQSLMVGETLNNITGRTVNPYNRGLSCGGSSGGEGALVGFHGSPIGVGTDIGGSIRMPAAFNGLFGIRPSHGRMPYAGAANSMEGQETVHSVCGPMAHTAESLTEFLKGVLSQHPWDFDPKVIELPWRQEIYEEARVAKKLRIGILTTDGVVDPQPPIKRGLEQTRKALEAAGHEVVEFAPMDHARGVDIINRIYVVDAGKDIQNALEASGEPMIDNLKVLVDLDNMSTPLTINQGWDLNLEKYKYQSEYLEYLKKNPVDAFIMPVAPHAAVRHDHYFYYGYTSIINLLDYTSVVFPVGFQDPSIDKKDESYKPRSDLDKQVYEDYVPELYDGAPISLQIVGRRLTEEKVLGFAEVVAKALKAQA
ncbi:Acetamidase [Saitoella complicata NRRL Y-17804]|nr:Acetamidase [Saitoella complicata NRRL Y-17804]ODQ54789.1 Acetamidase [Saitoella complicata NRRL Y-17804]